MAEHNVHLALNIFLLLHRKSCEDIHPHSMPESQHLSSRLTSFQLLSLPPASEAVTMVTAGTSSSLRDALLVLSVGL